MKLPRFTLRDLFWLVLVVGLLFAWTFDSYAQRFRQAAAKRPRYVIGP